MRNITFVSIVASLVLAASSSACLAKDSAANPPGQPAWPSVRFEARELQALNLGEVEVEARFCGCHDKPTKHYPYSIVLLKTAKGDLVARPERHEGPVTYTPLAVRRGDQYCEVGSETQCFGSFADPCDFTDFKYGPSLAPFFPTCKTD